MRFPTEAVAVGDQGVVAFENWEGASLAYTGDDPSVSAVLDYDDVAGQTYRTRVTFDVGSNAYHSTGREVRGRAPSHLVPGGENGAAHA